MSEQFNSKDQEPEIETFPVEPRYHPIHKIPRVIYDFLASAKLAMALLVIILACSVTGVTVLRGQRAWELIFNTLWFNALLVLLVVNVACCFFGRIWGRRITIISFGMILFHLSFVTIFLGIVYNSLFYFRAAIRLSEGETLPNSDPNSYDTIERGRLFSFKRLKGDTTLITMHRDYRVSGEDKRAAYEVAVGEGDTKKRDIIYITHNLSYRGFTYLPDREGYSILAVLKEPPDREVYGAVIPLQSLKQQDGSHLYVTGTKDGIGGMPFPQGDVPSRFDLQLTYVPSKLDYRGGEVEFDLRELPGANGKRAEKPFAVGKVPVGKSFRFGGQELSAKEVRYWVGMRVVYEPGKPIVLASLWVGLGGMIITTLGRMFRRRR